MAKGLGKVAQALAIGVGAGMEGWGKGTMQSIMEQRKAALEEIKDKRAAQEGLNERTWRSEEAEKGRVEDRARDERSMAWDKEKFGLQEASEERRSNRSLSAQMTLAKMKGSGSGKEKTLPADLQKVEYLAGLLAEEEGSKTITSAHRATAFKQLNADKPTSSSDTRPTSVKEAEALADMRAQAEGRERTPADVRNAFEEMKLRPEKAAESVTPIQYSSALRDEMESLDPYGQKSASGQTEELRRQAMENLAAAGIARPGGAAAETVPTERMTTGTSGSWESPTVTTAPEPGQKTPPSAVEAEQKPLSGAGTEQKPFTAATPEDIMWFKEKAPSGAWVLYEGKLYTKP